MKPSIPEGAVLTVSPPRRPSLGKLPGAPSLRRRRRAQGARCPPGLRRRGEGGRRRADPRPRLLGCARASAGPGRLLPRPEGSGCKDRGAEQPTPRRAGGRREDRLRRAAVSGHAGSNPRGSSREAAGVAGQQRFFWNAGCGPLTQQKRNESARVILTNKLVHCRLRRNFPFLIYIRLRSLLDFFFFLT